MKNLNRVLALGVGMFVFLMMMPAASNATESIQLKSVSFLPKINYVTWGLTRLAERVNERSQGQLKIEFLGGPEVIPGEDLPEAVRKGVVDVVAVPGAFARGLVPEANAMHLSQYDPWEERERGFNKYMTKPFEEKMNSYYLGRCGDTGEAFFNIFTNKKVDRPQDLKGQRSASFGVTAVVNAALGLESVLISIPDVYTALERSMIDAYALPYQTVAAFGLQEVTKYMIEPGFFRSPTVILVNVDAWNKLAPTMQDLMIKTQMEVERDFVNTSNEVRGKMKNALLKGGVKVIEFSTADKQWYLDEIYKTAWNFFQKSVSPEAYNEIRKLISK
jgi:TRAP-type C4-dicarboxylate transport system substrate-binding protein